MKGVRNMKQYFKILLITLAIQLSGFAVSMLLINLSDWTDIWFDLAIVVIWLCILTSIIVDIVLAIRWGTSIGKKLIYIFLMPTNYLWLAWLIWVFWYVGQWIDMLMGIYP